MGSRSSPNRLTVSPKPPPPDRPGRHQNLAIAPIGRFQLGGTFPYVLIEAWVIDPLHGARFAVKLVEKPHKRLNRKQRGLWTSRVRATRKLLIYIVKQLT